MSPLLYRIERSKQREAKELNETFNILFPFVLCSRVLEAAQVRERSLSFDKSTCFDAVKEATKTHPRETAPGTSYHCQCANQRREREVDGLSSGKPHVVLRIWPRVTEHTRSSNTHQKHIPVVHPSDTDAYWFTLLCT